MSAHGRRDEAASCLRRFMRSAATRSIPPCPGKVNVKLLAPEPSDRHSPLSKAKLASHDARARGTDRGPVEARGRPRRRPSPPAGAPGFPRRGPHRGRRERAPPPQDRAAARPPRGGRLRRRFSGSCTGTPRATAFPVYTGADAALRSVFDFSRPAFGGEERSCALNALHGVIAKLRPLSFILA